MGSGDVCFLDLTFDYTSSVKSCNLRGERNLGYACFVAGNHLSLTPLSKLLIPPPLSHRQIDDLKSFPSHIDMFGHALLCLMNDGSLMFTKDVSKPKEHKRLLLADFAQDVSQSVIKLRLFRIGDEFYCALVENLDISLSLNEDKLTFFKLKVDVELSVNKTGQYRLSKIASLSVNALIRYGTPPKQGMQATEVKNEAKQNDE